MQRSLQKYVWCSGLGIQHVNERSEILVPTVACMIFVVLHKMAGLGHCPTTLPPVMVMSIVHERTPDDPDGTKTMSSSALCM